MRSDREGAGPQHGSAPGDYGAQVDPPARTCADSVAGMVSTSIRQEDVAVAFCLAEDAVCAAPLAAAGFAKQMRQIFTCAPGRTALCLR